MGFDINRPFDEVKKEAGNAVNTIRGTVQGIGNASRGSFGSFGYLSPFGGSQLEADYFNQEDKKKAAEADAEAAQERLNQSVTAADRLRAQQGVFAANLATNAFRDEGLLTGQVAGNERRAMADSIRNAKLSAKSRGLLGSGFQKEQEAGSRATAAANTTSKQKQIHDLLGQQVMDAENLKAQLGLEMGGLQQNMSDQYYQMAIQNMNQRNQNIGDITGAGARIGGSYLGSRQQPQQQQNWWDVK